MKEKRTSPPQLKVTLDGDKDEDLLLEWQQVVKFKVRTTYKEAVRQMMRDYISQQSKN